MPSSISKHPKVFLFLISLLSSLLVSEIVLRISTTSAFLSLPQFTAFIQNIPTTSIYQKSQDPILELEFIPNSSWGHIRINSHGFRGPGYPKEVPQNTQRIALLGDSQAFAALLNENQTLSGQLESLLNNTSDQKFQVLNFGFPGTNTDTQLHLLQTKVLDFNPSTVILYYLLNDTIPGNQTVHIKDSLLTKSHLYLFYKFIQTRSLPSLHQNLHTTQEPVKLYQQLHSSQYFSHTTSVINQMAQLLSQKNIRFILVISPEIISFDSFANYPYQNIHQKLSDLSSDTLEVIDPLPQFKALNKSPSDLWATPTDSHHGQLATQTVATTIFDYLTANQATPSTKPTPP